MNTGVILKLECRVAGETEYQVLGFTGFSASFACNQEQTTSGAKFSLKIQAKVPKVGAGAGSQLFYLAGRPLEIRFRDSNGTVHLAGSTAYPARLSYNQSIGGSPGDWNGYEITILQDAPSPHTSTSP